MKTLIALCLISASLVLAGCGPEATPDSADTVKEIQQNNQPNAPEVPDHLKARGKSPDRGSGGAK